MRAPFACRTYGKNPDDTVSDAEPTDRLLQTFLLSSLVRRITGKSVRVLPLKPNQGLDYIDELFETGKIKPVIDGPYKIADTVDAIKRFGGGEHIGKVVVTVQDA